MMRLSLNILDHFLANNNNATTMAKLFWTFGLFGVEEKILEREKCCKKVLQSLMTEIVFTQ